MQLNEVDLIGQKLLPYMTLTIYNWLLSEINMGHVRKQLSEQGIFLFGNKNIYTGASLLLEPKRSTIIERLKLDGLLQRAAPDFIKWLEEKNFSIGLMVKYDGGLPRLGKHKKVVSGKYYHSDSNKTIQVNVDFNKEDLLSFLKSKKGFKYILNSCYSTILHELNHAYKDFKSSGKIFGNKDSKKWKDSGGENLNSYFNDQAEVEARFSEALPYLDFTQNFSDVKKKFDALFSRMLAKQNMTLDTLRPSVKKKLLRDLYKVWLDRNGIKDSLETKEKEKEKTMVAEENMINEVDFGQQKLLPEIADMISSWLSDQMDLLDVKHSAIPNYFGGYDLFAFNITDKPHKTPYISFFEYVKNNNQKLSSEQFVRWLQEVNFYIGLIFRVHFSGERDDINKKVPIVGGGYSVSDKFIVLRADCNQNEFDELFRSTTFEEIMSRDYVKKVIVHELDHAYKDFKSSGGIYKTKEFKKIKDNPGQYSGYHSQTYINSQHEIEARFYDTIDSLDFSGPFYNVLEKFKMNFGSNSGSQKPYLFDSLREYNKKKLIRDLYKVWSEKNAKHDAGASISSKERAMVAEAVLKKIMLNLR